MRSTYLQQAKEHIEQSIKVLDEETRPELQKTKTKYLCKLLEAIAHLLCDPYIFDQGEVYLKRAESLYLENKEALGADLYRRFLVKK